MITVLIELALSRYIVLSYACKFISVNSRKKTVSMLIKYKH